MCVGSDLCRRTTPYKTVSRRIPSTLWFLKLLIPEYVGFGSACVGGAGKNAFFCMLVLPIYILYLLKIDVKLGISASLSNSASLDAECLVVGESQGSSRRSVGKYPVKPPRPEGDSQTIGTYRCRNH